jgi:hypothetical protein
MKRQHQLGNIHTPIQGRLDLGCKRKKTGVASCKGVCYISTQGYHWWLFHQDRTVQTILPERIQHILEVLSFLVEDSNLQLRMLPASFEDCQESPEQGLPGRVTSVQAINDKVQGVLTFLGVKNRLKDSQ